MEKHTGKIVDNESKILKAIMERYRGLSTLRVALYEDTDTVVVNLVDDMEDKVTEEEILNYIQKILG